MSTFASQDGMEFGATGDVSHSSKRQRIEVHLCHCGLFPCGSNFEKLPLWPWRHSTAQRGSKRGGYRPTPSVLSPLLRPLPPSHINDITPGDLDAHYHLDHRALVPTTKWPCQRASDWCVAHMGSSHYAQKRTPRPGSVASPRKPTCLSNGRLSSGSFVTQADAALRGWCVIAQRVLCYCQTSNELWRRRSLSACTPCALRALVRRGAFDHRQKPVYGWCRALPGHAPSLLASNAL